MALSGLMVRYNIGVQDQQTYVIKRVDEDFFDENLPCRRSGPVERLVERQAAKSQCNQCFRCGPSCYLCRSSHESRRPGLS